jgi:hypothetical protein
MSETIHSLVTRLNEVTNDVNASFGGMTAEQLNWKPNLDSWSVGQCLDHLINSNAAYFPVFEKVIDGTYQPNGWSRLPFAADFFGKLLKKAVHPDSVKKNKTFPVFEPAQSDISSSIASDFEACQHRLASFIERLDKESYLATKVASPVNNVINLRVRDALEMLVLHDRRHFNQAVRVTEFTTFPA